MTIQDIYSQYKIPPNLQRHQFEVTAVGRYICDHWIGDPLDKDLVTKALLLHDMGNIIKFKRPFLGELERDAQYWEGIQEEFIEKYGNDVHTATNRIVAKITEDKKIHTLVGAIGSSMKMDATYLSLENRICDYADMCVTPTGITDFETRLADLSHRYGWGKKDWDFERQNAKFLERYVDTNLASIGEIDFSKEIEMLKTYTL